MSDDFSEFDSIDPVGTIHEILQTAIELGAPVFNCGDERGCFDIYAATARMLLQIVRDADEELTVLREALQEAAVEPSTYEQAWIMRRAFDIILGEDIEGKFDNRN